jgi:hypothetical protein
MLLHVISCCLRPFLQTPFVISCYFRVFSLFFGPAISSFLQYVNITQAREDFSSRFHLPCPFSCDSCHSPVRHRLGDGGWADLPVLLVSALVAPKRSGGGFPLSRFPIWLRLRRAVSLPSFPWICLNLPQMALD